MKNIIALITSLSLLPFGWGNKNVSPKMPPTNQVNFQKHPVQAGDLGINWGGIPDGLPIFTINNMLPGDTETRNITITNNANSPRPIGVRGKQLDPNDLTPALRMEISAGTETLYNKTLAEFFSDSGSNTNTGINLVTINPHNSKTVIFKVTFVPDTNNNNYKDAKTVFDLTLGIYMDVPEQCAGIKFDNIIYGTEKGENLTGNKGNNLIIGFGGNDKIEGNNNDDCIIGGDGDDRIHGNNGNDVLIGGRGINYLDGGNGYDICAQGSMKSCEKSY